MGWRKHSCQIVEGDYTQFKNPPPLDITPRLHPYCPECNRWMEKTEYWDSNRSYWCQRADCGYWKKIRWSVEDQCYETENGESAGIFIHRDLNKFKWRVPATVTAEALNSLTDGSGVADQLHTHPALTAQDKEHLKAALAVMRRIPGKKVNERGQPSHFDLPDVYHPVPCGKCGLPHGCMCPRPTLQEKEEAKHCEHYNLKYVSKRIAYELGRVVDMASDEKHYRCEDCGEIVGVTPRKISRAKNA